MHVPIIALMDVGNNAADSEAIAQHWGAALSEFGFALVDSSAVDDLAKALEHSVRTFCSQPLDVKKRYQLTEHYKWGYGHPGQIAVSQASSIRHRNSDATETITLPVLSEKLDEMSASLIPHPHFSVTTDGRCPDYEDASLREGIVAYRRLCEAVLLPKALEATALYFGLQRDYLRDAFRWEPRRTESAADATTMNCFGRIAVNHYLPRWMDDQLEYGEHTDTSMFTFVRRSGENGLQFRCDDHDDDWVDLPWHPQLLVVNAGDTAARMTNGHWRAVPHRVGAPDSGGIASLTAAGGPTPVTISYFAQPHDEHILEPLPSSRIEQPVRPEFLPTLTSGGLREAKTNNMRKA